MPEALKKLIDIISFLPGIGEKTAVRLGFFLLKANKAYISNFAKYLEKVQNEVSECKSCFSYTDSSNELCSICLDQTRSDGKLCIVEDYMDMLSIERLKIFKGRYFILGGAISPVNGILASDLRFKELFEFILKGNFQEIILALNPNMEGEATAIYIRENMPKSDVILTKLSKGLPNSGYIEYADDITLINAFKGRS